ncbi:MAG: ABC transporter substrate-binding protein [Chloroflexota bacterium]
MPLCITALSTVSLPSELCQPIAPYHPPFLQLHYRAGLGGLPLAGKPVHLIDDHPSYSILRTAWQFSVFILPLPLRPFVACVLLLTGVLAGCGAHPAAHGSTLTVWYSTDDPVERAWSQQIAQHFQSAHPGIQVRFNVLSFEDMNTKLQLALSGGTPPDLAYVTPRGPGIPAYVGHGKLRNLSRYAQAYGWAAKLRPGLLASYNRPFSFYGARQGTVVAVPMAMAAVGLMYNVNLLHRLHLGVPTTLPQLETDLMRSKAAGYTALGMGNGDGWLGDDWYLTLVNSLVPIGQLAPEQTLQPAFSFLRPPYVHAGSILQQWANRGYFTKDFGGLDAQEGVDQFFQGHTVFQLISSSENAQILRDQRRTRIRIAVTAFPTADQRGVVPASGYLGWVVPKASASANLAAQFINSVLSGQTSKFLIRKGVLPAARSPGGGRSAPGWQRQYLHALDTAHHGVYLDAAPIANMNATMEANVQLLLQGYEAPGFLVKSLQESYATHGHSGSTARIDGEF